MQEQKPSPQTPAPLTRGKNAFARLHYWWEEVQTTWALLKGRFGNLAGINFELGCQYLEQGNADDAIFRFRVVTWISPDDVRGWYMLAMAYYARGDRGKAQRYVNKALTINPTHEDAKALYQTLHQSPVNPT